MSADTDLILEKVRNLSISELLIVQETIIWELRQKTRSTSEPTPGRANGQRYIRIPGAYQPTREEVEASLARIFTPTELAEIGKRDFTKIDLGSKSLSEMVNEDREDRF